ncbi:MAG: type IV pilin protein [Legionellaceae bacterium]|nr:type IV pilin protein [Legionellaceae bacterium]
MPNGFSLIELMVVLMIISILACFTYPSYKSQVTRAHRIDGQTALFDLANRMERYYARKNTYEKASIGTGGPNDIVTLNTSSEGWYTLSITEATHAFFTLQATPNKTQALNDRYCQSLTLNSVGIKGSASKLTESCW